MLVALAAILLLMLLANAVQGQLGSMPSSPTDWNELMSETPLVVENTGGGGVVANISGTNQPQEAVYDPHNGTIYIVLAQVPNGLEVLNGTHEVGTAPTHGWMGYDNALEAAYDPVNHYVYAANDNGRAINIDYGLSNVTWITDMGCPGDAIFDPADLMVYVTDTCGGGLTFVNGTTLVGSVAAGGGSSNPPMDLAYDPDNGDVYAVNTSANTVDVVHGTTVVARVPVGSNPQEVAVDPASDLVYVANAGSDNATVVNGDTQRVVTNIPLSGQPNSMVYDPADNAVYVSERTSPPNGWIDILSGTALATSVYTATISTYMAYDPVNGDVYGAAYNNNEVTVLNGETLLANIGVGQLPNSIGIDTADDYLYVTDYQSDNVTVIDGGSTPALAVSSFSAVPSPVHVGGTAYLNATTNGGSGALTYLYKDLPPGCTTANASALVCHPTGAGSFQVRVFANDTVHQSATSVTFLGVTSSGPSISSFTASPSTIPLGSTSFLNVSATGGTGTLTYAYAGLPAGCSSRDSSILACSPALAGTFSLRAFVNDSAGYGSNSTTSLTVTPAAGTLIDISVSPASAYVGTGASRSFTAAPTCASGPCPAGTTYAWSMNQPLGTFNTSTGSVVRLTAGSTPGTTYLFVNATLRSVTLESSAVPVTIASDSPPILSSFTASPATVPFGNGVQLTAVATGGVGSLTYTYVGLPAGCSTQNSSSWTCTPTAVGSYAPGVYVNDSLGGSASSSTTFTVVPSLSSIAVSPPSTTLGPAGAVTFNATPGCTGGPCPAGTTYSWSLNLALGTLNATTGSVVKFTAGATPGTTYLFVNATLNSGSLQSAAVPITITRGPPSRYTVNFRVNPLGCGYIDFNGTDEASGNTVAFDAGTYEMYALPCNGYDFAQSTLRGTQGGSQVFTTVWANATLARNATLWVNYTSSPPPPPVRYWVQFQIPQGPCGPLVFNGTAQADGSSDYYLPGFYSAVAPNCPAPWGFVNWTYDEGGTSRVVGTSSANIDIVGSGNLTALYEPYTVSLSANRSTLYVGGSVIITPSITWWGSAADGCTWSLNATNLTLTSCESSDFSFGHPGTYTYAMWVHDDTGRAVTSNAIAITVNALPSATPPPLVAFSNASALSGTFIGACPGSSGIPPPWQHGFEDNFSGDARGGVPPYTLTWSFGNGVISSESGRNDTAYFGYGGSQVVSLRVSDSRGDLAWANLTLDLTEVAPTCGSASSGGPTFLGLGEAEGVALIAGLTAASLVAAAVVLLRRRRRSKERPPSVAPGAAYQEPAP